MPRNRSNWTIMLAMLVILPVLAAVWAGCRNGVPPSLQVVSPQARDLLGAIITVRVQVDDSDLSTVEYAVDTGPFQSLNRTSSPGIFEAALDTSALSRGEHAITVRATNADDNTGSLSIDIEVDNPPRLPAATTSRPPTSRSMGFTPTRPRAGSPTAARSG